MTFLDDGRWEDLTGGYGAPFDPREPIRRFALNWSDDRAWSTLWEELYHQGDIGTAAFAAVVALASIAADQTPRGWRFYGFAAVVETERHAVSNPEVPGWLVEAYRDVWSSLRRLALQDLATALDAETLQSALAVVALSQGQVRLGAHLATLDASEVDEALEECLGWSGRYDEGRGRPEIG